MRVNLKPISNTRCLVPKSHGVSYNFLKEKNVKKVSLIVLMMVLGVEALYAGKGKTTGLLKILKRDGKQPRSTVKISP